MNYYRIAIVLLVFGLLMLASATPVYSITDRVRIGLTVAPGVSWAKPYGKELKASGAGFGFQYGVNVEYWFAENYGLTGGLMGSMENAGITNRLYFANRDTAGTILSYPIERYTFHSLVLPVALKLRTNEIKQFRIYGEVGFENFFTVAARATFDQAITNKNTQEILNIEKENILRKNNDVTKVMDRFRANFYDLRLRVGGGFEYHFSDKIALFTGLYYHNGFLNYIRDNDAKKEPVVLRSVNLHMGVIF